MKSADRVRLTNALREHVAKIAADLRLKMRASGPVRERAIRLHADEKVAEDFDVWTDLLSRRAAVLWVLKSVYVRVLEDRGLLAPGRLLDAEAQQLFERLAPHLGETAFLRWIYRDLASPDGGLPELFSSQPAEVALPSDDLSRALIAFWRHRDADTGAVWGFAEEHFEGELMGDLYQELDPVVKDRFALCQTPDFVRAFILDRTLTPAMKTFGADEVRLLDPACGSGHFLIDGLKRLVAATAAKHPEWHREKVVAHALDRVVGIDLNDYACALARTRVIMTAAELSGVTKLADAARFHPHVYWADGLEQVEREEQNAMAQTDLFTKVEERPRATFTRSDVRVALKKVFETKFHAVVGNPPYIEESDEARRAYQTEKVGRNRRYISAYNRYSLGGPFVERCFQVAQADAFVGVITSNNFQKRGFGKPFIEQVLARIDLSLVVDTSQAYLPHHGTATVLLFGRNRLPRAPLVRALMSRGREPGTPAVPAEGKVWSSILQGVEQPGFENEFISVVDLGREVLSKHPWSLGGSEILQLKALLEERAEMTLAQHGASLGMMTMMKQDDVYFEYPAAVRVENAVARVDVVEGNRVRDYCINDGAPALFPYEPESPSEARVLDERSAAARHFWRYRFLLERRTSVGFKTVAHRGLRFYEYPFYYPETYAGLTITYAFVSSHNHFALSRGGRVFKQSAPALKLSSHSTEEDYLTVLGFLNASTVCFWMKRVFQPKSHASQRHHPDPARAVYEFNPTGLESLPVPPLARISANLAALARLLDETASSSRALMSAAAVARSIAETRSGDELRTAMQKRWAHFDKSRERMVAWQEELDWLVYNGLGLADAGCLADPARYAEMTCPRGDRPFERSVPRASTIRAGGDVVPLDEAEVPAVGTLPKWAETLWADRVAALEGSGHLKVLETTVYKRAWRDSELNIPESRYRSERDREDLLRWLTDHSESWAKTRSRVFTRAQLVAALQDDEAVLRVCEVLTGRRDFSLDEIVAEILAAWALPNHPDHVYTDSGLAKRAAWEDLWAAQRREDAGQPKAELSVPPEFSQGSRGKTTDYLRAEYWRLRAKLDVPQEMFVLFSEVPGRAGVEALYGWAGWTPQQRLKVLLAVDEELEDASVPLADRIGLLDSAWRLLPEVVIEDVSAASRLKAELQALVGPEGPSAALIEDWKKRFPPPTSRAARRPSEEADAEDSFDDLPAVIPNVSDGEDPALFIWALLHASGGTATRMDLARAFALRVRPALLKRLAPASLKREVAHWATTVGSRSVKAGMLVSTLRGLAGRNGVSLGKDSESRATVSTSPYTPTEAQIDPWYHFEADLALKVLRAQPEEKLSAIDKALTGADRKLLETAA